MSITINDNGLQKTLIVDELSQSAYPPPDKGGYWRLMMPDRKPDRVLMLGVGGGTIPRMLLEKYPDVKIVGVEISEAIVNAAIEHLKLDEVNMDLIVADAFEYVYQDIGKFDFIIVDLFDGFNFPLKCISPKFVERLQELLNKGGELYMNIPNIDHALSLILPTRIKEDNGANIIYKFTKGA